MPKPGPIADPRMLDRLRDFYPSLCTIKEPTVTEDGYGAEVIVWINDFAGHVNLACAIGPTGGREVKLPDQTYVVANYTVSLAGHYPDIDEKMRAEVDGEMYGIVLVQSDSHGKTTRLLANKVA